MEIPKEKTAEQALKLLWNQANTLPQNNHTNQLLRSFYLTTCKKLSRHGVRLPAENFAPFVMCPKCSSIWSESKFSLVLKPLRIHSNKAEKLVDKLNDDQKSLTRKQKKRAKWLKKKISNCVEITCEFCKKKTRQMLIRTKAKPKVVEETKPDIQIPVKKKKKSKDKTAGLKLDKVTPQVTQVKKISLPVNKPNLPSKKTNKPKQQPPKAKVEKTISKTQKQNSLLQLAKMLKNQGASSVNKSMNQLEKLLK